jgi:hypothetical protein
MDSVKEQRICIKLCFKVGKSAAQTNSVLHEGYSNSASSSMMNYKWFVLKMEELNGTQCSLANLQFQDPNL